MSLKVFTGNTDNTGIVYAWLTAPTRARFVRFRASDVSGAHICVRMEYFGSRDSQGIAGYVLSTLSLCILISSMSNLPLPLLVVGSLFCLSEVI